MSVVYPEGPFTIYHVIDEKVGATHRFRKRCRENKRNYKLKYDKDITIEIIEVCSTAEEADERENYWSIELGYGEIEPQDRYLVRLKVGQDKKRNKKISKALKDKPKSEEHKQALKDNHARYWEGKSKPESVKQSISATMKEQYANGRVNAMTGCTRELNPNYGTGFLYKELTTGFTGYGVDMCEHFDMRAPDLLIYARRGNVIKKSEKYRGLQFIIVDQPAM